MQYNFFIYFKMVCYKIGIFVCIYIFLIVITSTSAQVLMKNIVNKTIINEDFFICRSMIQQRDFKPDSFEFKALLLPREYFVSNEYTLAYRCYNVIYDCRTGFEKVEHSKKCLSKIYSVKREEKVDFENLCKSKVSFIVKSHVVNLVKIFFDTVNQRYFADDDPEIFCTSQSCESRKYFYMLYNSYKGASTARYLSIRPEPFTRIRTTFHYTNESTSIDKHWNNTENGFVFFNNTNNLTISVLNHDICYFSMNDSVFISITEVGFFVVYDNFNDSFSYSYIVDEIYDRYKLCAKIEYLDVNNKFLLPISPSKEFCSFKPMWYSSLSSVRLSNEGYGISYYLRKGRFYLTVGIYDFGTIVNNTHFQKNDETFHLIDYDYCLLQNLKGFKCSTTGLVSNINNITTHEYYINGYFGLVDLIEYERIVSFENDLSRDFTIIFVLLVSIIATCLLKITISKLLYRYRKAKFLRSYAVVELESYNKMMIARANNENLNDDSDPSDREFNSNIGNRQGRFEGEEGYKPKLTANIDIV